MKLELTKIELRLIIDELCAYRGTCCRVKRSIGERMVLAEVNTKLNNALNKGNISSYLSDDDSILDVIDN